MIALLLIVGSTAARASPDAPLSIYYTEYVNATLTADTHYVHIVSWNIAGNLTVANLAPEPVYDIYVAVYQNSTLLGSSTYFPWRVAEKPAYLASIYCYVQGVNDTSLPSYVLDKVPSEAGYTYIVFHIVVLQPGDRVVLNYTITDLQGLRFPIKISESVLPDKILDGVPTVMNVNITVANSLDQDLNVKLRKILPADGTPDDGWSNAVTNNPEFIAAGTASTGVAAIGTAKTWWWTGDGAWPGTWVTLTVGASASITGIQINGTADAAEVGGATTLITLGTLEVYINASQPITGSHLGSVQAIGQASIEAKKSQEAAAPGYAWNETLTFCDTSGTFSYEVYNRTLWATADANPSGTPITGSRQSEYSAPTPLATLAPGTCMAWGPFEFNSTVVPWVWGYAAAGIVKDEVNGWWLYNATESFPTASGSGLLLSEQVWLVKGYLLKVEKEVYNSTPNSLSITVTIWNIGDVDSPYASAYDLVPSGFTADETTMHVYPYSQLAVDNGAAGPTAPDFTQKVTNPMDGYSYGYVWEFYPIPAPARGFKALLRGGETATVTVTLSDGSTRQWSVQGVDGTSVLINGTTYNEGDSLTVAAGTPAETNFTITWIEDTIDAQHKGHIVVSAKSYNADTARYVYNPVVVHYVSSGTGNYNASKVFIVGVDPRHVLYAISVFQPNTTITAYLSNNEVLLALPTLLLGVAAALSRRGSDEEA